MSSVYDLEHQTSPDAQMRQLLELLERLVMACGGDPRSYFLTTLELPRRGRLPSELPLSADARVPVDSFAELLRRWHLDPEFLDEYGLPVPLAVVGSPSLATLIEREGLNFDPHDLREAFLRYGFAIEASAGQLRVIARVARGAPEFRLLYGLRLASLALRTCLHNIECVSAQGRWFQRTARGRIPAGMEPEFRSFVEGQGMALLSAVDDWLTKAAAEAEPNAQGASVAHVNLFLTLGSRDWTR